MHDDPDDSWANVVRHFYLVVFSLCFLLAVTVSPWWTGAILLSLLGLAIATFVTAAIAYGFGVKTLRTNRIVFAITFVGLGCYWLYFVYWKLPLAKPW